MGGNGVFTIEGNFSGVIVKIGEKFLWNLKTTRLLDGVW
jgi:hypothetical protein